MERILEWVDAAYGSVPEYLCEHGMDPNALARLQSSLVISDESRESQEGRK
jgi:hypothetical protein